MSPIDRVQDGSVSPNLLERSLAGRDFNRQRARAFDFLRAPRVRAALRLDREPIALREDYGLTLFGQACLSARRLLEAGVKVVTVVSDEFGKSDESWDTHHDHQSACRASSCPDSTGPLPLCSATWTPAGFWTKRSFCV